MTEKDTRHNICAKFIYLLHLVPLVQKLRFEWTERGVHGCVLVHLSICLKVQWAILGVKLRVWRAWKPPKFPFQGSVAKLAFSNQGGANFKNVEDFQVFCSFFRIFFKIQEVQCTICALSGYASAKAYLWMDSRKWLKTGTWVHWISFCHHWGLAIPNLALQLLIFAKIRKI